MISSTTGRTLAATLAGLALLACRLAAATPVAAISLSSSGRLAAGSNQTVSWTLNPSVALESDEMELVLSLDGGVTFPIRVSGRIEPAARSMVWRVPSLPTEHARLALRAGSGEEADTEEFLLWSETFAIEAAPGLPVETLFSVNEEWRTREALEGAPVRPVERNLAPGDSSPNLERLVTDTAELETAAVHAVVVDRQVTPLPRRGPASPREVPRPAGSFPAPLPLRL